MPMKLFKVTFVTDGLEHKELGEYWGMGEVICEGIRLSTLVDVLLRRVKYLVGECSWFGNQVTSRFGII